MRKLAVFCGSSTGRGELYLKLGSDLGHLLTKKNWGLVYGGASVGVMGAMADALLENKGRVWGVIPQSLVDWEVAHENLEELEVVDSMHQRKQRMYDLSDAFLAIPGGMGTLDELCEIITWAQLKHHKKPIYLLNFNGFFDQLIGHFQHCEKEGFLSKEHLKLIQCLNNLDDLELELDKQ
jgi:uncharacterized protein (TIGR00730 family)